MAPISWADIASGALLRSRRRIYSKLTTIAIRLRGSRHVILSKRPKKILNDERKRYENETYNDFVVHGACACRPPLGCGSRLALLMTTLKIYPLFEKQV